MSSDGDCGGGSRDGIVGSLVQRRPGGGAAVDSRTRDRRETVESSRRSRARTSAARAADVKSPPMPARHSSMDSEAAASTQRMLSACESEGT